MAVSIRQATPEDIQDIIHLCQQSIIHLCSTDYSPGQLNAWTKAVDNTKRFLTAINQQHFLLAIQEGKLIGLGSLTKDGLIDFLFTSHEYSGQGIARLILGELESIAKKSKMMSLLTYASKTSTPFFLRSGFSILQKNEAKIGKTSLYNHKMKKLL